MKRHSILLDSGGDGGGGDGDSAGGKGGDGTLSKEDLHKAIEKARLEERTKVQEAITRSQTELQKLKDDAQSKTKATDALNKQLADLTGQVEALTKAANPDGKGVDPKTLIAEVTANVEKRYNEATKVERAALESRLQSVQSDLEKMRLREMKGVLVAEAGGEEKLVMAMISGETEEALRASVKAAADAYADIEKRVTNSSGSAQAAQSQQSTSRKTPPTQRSGGQGGAGRGADSDTLETVREMTPEQYRLKRLEILQGVGKRFAV